MESPFSGFSTGGESRHAVPRPPIKERSMADRNVVANKDGPFKTNAIQVERCDFLAPGYELTLFEQTPMGATGRLKVLRLSPSSEQAAAPDILGRWDEPALSL